MLQNTLQKVVVPPSVQPNDVAALIQSMNSVNVDIVFHQSELPPLETQNQNDYLMIMVVINKCGIKHTLVDNGSMLNVCSINLLDKVGVDNTKIQLDSLSTYGFDNVGK